MSCSSSSSSTYRASSQRSVICCWPASGASQRKQRNSATFKFDLRQSSGAAVTRGLFLYQQRCAYPSEALPFGVVTICLLGYHPELAHHTVTDFIHGD